MNHHVKNVCITLAFVSTIIATCFVPHMIKWLMGMFIIMAIVLWLGDENE